ncbi:MAG: hypothetical protein ABSC51_07420 [Gaiellaceae bacterium]|jgi:hypothetical protein
MSGRQGGARPGNANAVKHGARSPRLIKARARAHRRRFLRQAGLRASDLDPITLAYLEGWARSLAKIDAYDDAEVERDPREYHAALNAARLWMAKLEARMASLGIDVRKSGADPIEGLIAQGRAIREAREAREAREGKVSDA